MNGRAASGNNCGRNPQFRRGRLAVLHLLVMQGSGTMRRKTGAQGREAPRPRRRHQPGEKRHQSKVYGGTSAIGFGGTGRRPPSVFGSCTTRFCLMPSGDSDGSVWRTTSIGERSTQYSRGPSEVRRVDLSRLLSSTAIRSSRRNLAITLSLPRSSPLNSTDWMNRPLRKTMPTLLRWGGLPIRHVHTWRQVPFGSDQSCAHGVALSL